jgi:hypothetical protein
LNRSRWTKSDKGNIRAHNLKPINKYHRQNQNHILAISQGMEFTNDEGDGQLGVDGFGVNGERYVELKKEKERKRGDDE